MSHTNRNFVIAYILLVGLPLLGLAGALKVGNGLHAPMAVDGTWKIDADSVHATGQSCAQAVSSLSVPSFAISQSGKTLVVTLSNAANTAGVGSLEGKNLKASFGSTDGSGAGCAADQPLVMTASIDPKAEPKSLAGIISVSGCTSCAAVEFHALRQPKTQSGEMH
ncbi:MAG TPA: hypothetical protein VGS27_10350 [Candidatus Sulfotelmatobacter sp.]|nr:hypothetical protein [Candidatus Sulfotelmatobacter sp.]